MESESTLNGDSNSWSSNTNWTVVSGTLVNSITFESFFSAINSDDDDLKSRAKHIPLILKPISLDWNPCEITINFAQKYELRQIYVKSSARVYEIYRQSNQQSESEYVWTVRCSAAAAQDDDDEALSRSSNDNHSSKSETSRIVSEDEWVKVKSPDSKQEYYEATAEFTDVDPCVSVTLRFLSLQSKDCVFVDEVYVFADPIESSTESENQIGKDSSSVIGMLLPSLFLMAKTKNSAEMQSNHTFETEAACSSKVVANGITSTEKIGSWSQRVDMAGTESQSPPKILSREREADDECTSNDRVERSLDKLCSRIGRIEDMFLRLEQSLVKPMNVIEARLARVEQQLEALSDKHDKTSEPPPYSRFWAPNFSSIESDSNSFHHSENGYRSYRSKEFESNAKSGPASGGYDVVNTTTLLLPSLVMTAPEFSCGEDDDDEENQMEDEDLVAVCAVEDQPKRALTVDDALSVALAGLMIEAGNHTPALSIEPTKFSNDDDGDGDDDAETNRKDPLGERENGSLSKASNNPCLIVDDGDESSGIPMDKRSEDSEANNHDDVIDSVDTYRVEADIIAVLKEEMRNAMQRKILESSFSATPVPVVDFELPILDVKFLSRDSGGSGERGVSLEALLSETRGEASLATEGSPRGNADCELICVEDSYETPVIDFDYDYCALQQPPLSLMSREEEEEEDETPLSLPLASHETFPTTLI